VRWRALSWLQNACQGLRLWIRGKDADLVVIDEKMHVYMTMVKGKVVFRAD
jgi:N-acetylglucosamine-6-phosphate deacetylase